MANPILRDTLDRGRSQVPELAMFDFTEFCKLIGFEEVWAFEKRWSR